MSLHAVVLAGGPGERFWPASTPGRPKPFLRVWGERSLLQEAVARAEAVAGRRRVWVSSSAAYRRLLAAQLPDDLAGERLILEPVRRDTAPAIGLAAVRLRLGDPGAVLAVLPADHFVGDLAAFVRAVRTGTRTAQLGHLVTLGVAASRPETGYGYIRCGDPVGAPDAGRALRVDRFVEKPDAAAALAFLGDGRHLWNTGVLIARADAVLEAVGRHLPELAAGLSLIGEAYANGGPGAGAAALGTIYPRLPAVSFDYGVLQRAGNLAVVPGEFAWDDVGGWDALTRIGADADGNHIHGACIALDLRGSVLRNESADRMLIGFGLEDVAVVVTDREVVVAPRRRSGEWKRMLGALRQHGYGPRSGGPGGGAAQGDAKRAAEVERPVPVGRADRSPPAGAPAPQPRIPPSAGR